MQSRNTEVPNRRTSKTPIVMIISGPSGVGKDAVVNRMRQRGVPFQFVTTVTSRRQRHDEVHGRDYYFVSKEQFEELISRDALLEHATVYGEYKGVPRDQIERALACGSDVVLRLDVQGAATVKNIIPSAVSVFIVPPSMNDLARRLLRRNTEADAEVADRIATAEAELKRSSEFDYLVVNRDGHLDEVVDIINAILVAEKVRTSRLRK